MYQPLESDIYRHCTDTMGQLQIWFSHTEGIRYYGIMAWLQGYYYDNTKYNI